MSVLKMQITSEVLKMQIISEDNTLIAILEDEELKVKNSIENIIEIIRKFEKKYFYFSVQLNHSGDLYRIENGEGNSSEWKSISLFLDNYYDFYDKDVEEMTTFLLAKINEQEIPRTVLINMKDFIQGKFFCEYCKKKAIPELKNLIDEKWHCDYCVENAT